MLSTPGVNSFACMLCTNFKMPSKMSKSKSSKKGGKGITPKNVSKDQMQHLLQDIKKLNLPRDKVALNEVLEGDPKYCKKQKSLTHGFQKKWDLALQCEPLGHIKLLFQHDVEPSQAAQKELKDAEKDDNVKDTSENEEADGASNLTECGSENDDNNDDDNDDDDAFSLVTGVSAMPVGSPTLLFKKKRPMKMPKPKKTKKKGSFGKSFLITLKRMVH